MMLGAFLLCIVSSWAISPDPDADKVTDFPHLPPEPDLTFNVFSGYINLVSGKALHYVFMTSQKSTSDPVVLWLNGGPGCSSMDGLFYENGPFVFPEGTNVLQKNAYSWNRVANMLYFESPAGVGYSKYGDKANLHTNDTITANDNLEALVRWFSAFTDFKNNEFYISGESYAGIYVPMLALNIINHNKNAPNEVKINLKGFLVGNGAVNWNYDAEAAFPDFAWDHALYDYKLRIEWESANCYVKDREFPTPKYPCEGLYNKTQLLMSGINIYDIYRDCVYPQSTSKHLYTQWATHLGDAIPCVDDYGLTYYMNLPEVRESFHIDPIMPYWTVCANISYTMDFARGSYYVYQELAGLPDMRILIYSGDTDSTVPTNGSKRWFHQITKERNLPLTTPWKPWYTDKQVAGFTTSYNETFTFTTIKGTGHMSIQWKRPEGFKMFESFLKNQPLN